MNEFSRHVSRVRARKSLVHLLGVVATVLLAASTAAADTPAATLEQRVSGADSVVVATARHVAASWHENQHGDRIIVSRILLEVEETLKGAARGTVWLEVDGGTLDGLTLRVSGIPVLQPGERGVLFLEPAGGEIHRPYLRGQGILRLDDQNLVRGTNLGLNEIRSRARAVGR